MGGVLDREEIKAYTVLHYMHLAEYMTYTNFFFFTLVNHYCSFLNSYNMLY